MQIQNSYNLPEDEQALQFELQRLQAQVELSWREEHNLLQKAGMCEGIAVADLGCGPGFIAEKLLESYSEIQVTAIDQDPRLLGIASARLQERFGSRLTLVPMSAEATGAPDNGFDIVVARYLFQHLADPDAVAREALRILRPGGRLVVIDIDAALLGILEPTVPMVQQIFQRARVHQGQRGGNPIVGRQLWRILQQAGFEAPKLEVFNYHSDELGVEAFAPQLATDQLAEAHAAGVISQAEFTLAKTSYEQFYDNPDAYILMLGFFVSGQKGEPS